VPSAEDLFDALVSVYVDKSEVHLGNVFHKDVLKVNDKIFAMLVRRQLVGEGVGRPSSSIDRDGRCRGL
jgi:hypothetical protein